ncbi:hypothetical protein MRX96_023512 [Rhipicephalus microplus]
MAATPACAKPETGKDDDDPTIVMAAIETQVGIYVQRIVERPKDMPSDHADEVHDWVGWPTFPPKGDGDRQQRPIVMTKVPQVTHVNRHEFLPKMELQMNTQGRFIQPAPSFRLTNLMDDLQYTIWLTFTELHGGRMRWPVHPSGISPSGLLLERQGGLLRSAEAVLQRWNHTPPTAHHPEEQHHLPHTSEHWSRQRQRTHPERHSRPPVRRWHLLRGRPDRQEVQLMKPSSELYLRFVFLASSFTRGSCGRFKKAPRVM